MPSSWHKTGLPSRQRYVLRQMEVFFSMIQTAMCSNAGGQQPRVTPHTLQHDREVIDCRTIDHGNRTGSAGRHLPLCGEGKLSLAVFRRSPQGDTFEQHKTPGNKKLQNELQRKKQTPESSGDSGVFRWCEWRDLNPCGGVSGNLSMSSSVGT